MFLDCRTREISWREHNIFTVDPWSDQDSSQGVALFPHGSLILFSELGLWWYCHSLTASWEIVWSKCARQPQWDDRRSLCLKPRQNAPKLISCHSLEGSSLDLGALIPSCTLHRRYICTKVTSYTFLFICTSVAIVFHLESDTTTFLPGAKINDWWLRSN